MIPKCKNAPQPHNIKPLTSLEDILHNCELRCLLTDNCLSKEIHKTHLFHIIVAYN